MAMSVDGLVTGMKTTDTINQLMQVEALPQAALKTKVGVANKVVSAYQSVNTRLASLATAAKALGNADTWTSMKATSSSDAAVVTALPGAAPGSMSFRIDSLAAAHTMTFSAGSVTSASDNIMSGATLVVKLKDGSDKTLAPTDKSLETVVAAINAETDAAYRAAAVQITPGHYTLQLTAKETGATAFAGAPADIDLLGAAAITTQGTNATLTVGTTNPYSIESATNTCADVLPGVTVTAVREQAVGDPRITIGLSADVDGIAAKVQALVDNANVALSEIAAQTKGKTDVVAAGALVGDSAMRQLSQDILSVVSSGVAIGGSLNSFSSVGVELDRSGKLTFTKQTFVDAYKADPTKTQAFFDSYTDENGSATTRRFHLADQVKKRLVAGTHPAPHRHHQ
jgi:flagellar hook-associated protein 2